MGALHGGIVFHRSLPSFVALKLWRSFGHFYLSMSVGLPETYEVGGGPIDPEDYLEYEDRQEVLRSMARLMDDEPQDDQPEPEPPANIERVWPPVIDDEIPF